MHEMIKTVTVVASIMTIVGAAIAVLSYIGYMPRELAGQIDELKKMLVAVVPDWIVSSVLTAICIFTWQRYRPSLRKYINRFRMLAGFPNTVILPESEYNALDHKDPCTVYLTTKDDSEPLSPQKQAQAEFDSGRKEAERNPSRKRWDPFNVEDDDHS